MIQHSNNNLIAAHNNKTMRNDYALILILNLAKQIIIRGYLLLEFLEIIFRNNFFTEQVFFLQMPYELLSQSRKLNKRGGPNGIF